MLKYKNIGYMSADSPKSQLVLEQLKKHYQLEDASNMLHQSNLSNLDAIVILGGDGFMLKSASQCLGTGVPLYGINCGTVGFLLNDFDEQSDLLNKIENSYAVKVNPLRIILNMTDGKQVEINAINELSLLRSNYLAICLRIKINGRIKINRLVSDGLLISTPIGSSAYNFSVGGPILPLYCDLLSIVPISPFRPRKWSGAILPGSATVEIELIEPEQRSANVSADFQCFENIISIQVQKHDELSATLLFDSQFCLEDRMINEQFIRD